MTCDVVAVCFFHPSERRDSGAEAGRGVPAPVLRPLKRRVLRDIKKRIHMKVGVIMGSVSDYEVMTEACLLYTSDAADE